jgi:two-component system, sensor histidine kinase
MNLNSSYSHKYVPANIPLWLLVPAFFLALILNHYKIPFFAGSHLIFGNIIAIIVLFYYGLMPALFISLLAGTVTYFTWGNAINLIPNALEIIVLNLAIKRLFNPMVIGMIYWATLGWMLTALSLYLFTDFELMTKYAIIIKYFVNGILNLLVSLIIVRCIAYYFNLNIYGSMVKFSHKLTNHIFYIVSITLILSFLVGLKFVQQRELASFQQRLKVRSDNLVESIEGYPFSNPQGLERQNKA